MLGLRLGEDVGDSASRGDCPSGAFAGSGGGRPTEAAEKPSYDLCRPNRPSPKVRREWGGARGPEGHHCGFEVSTLSREPRPALPLSAAVTMAERIRDCGDWSSGGNRGTKISEAARFCPCIVTAHRSRSWQPEPSPQPQLAEQSNAREARPHIEGRVCSMMSCRAPAIILASSGSCRRSRIGAAPVQRATETRGRT